jgi:alpha-tubulin suppressor-like RCC1 family protein/uncharacterized protein YjdB
MNKCKFLLGVTLLLALIFSGCPDPVTPGETSANAAPANMGYFSLSIGGGGASRTIMPVMPAQTSLYYKLEFYQSNTTTNLKTIGPVSNENLSTPVLLEAGTYDLVVRAYKDETGTQKTAESEKTVIVITSGATTTKSVELKPITATGSGQGTFKWTISYPDDVSFASMTIAKAAGETGDTYYFKGVAPSIGTDSSMPWDTGYYYVTFNLTMDGKKLERKEILHIYQNLESFYTVTFTKENFFAKMSGITIDPGSKTIYTIGEPLALNIYAVYDDGSTSLILDVVTTSGYNANTAGTQTVTITHANTGFKASIPVTVLGSAARIGAIEYPTLYEAISKAIDGTEDKPTEIVILRNITAPEAGTTMTGGYSIPANKHIKLTVESNQSRTITASPGDFRLFSVSNASSSLTLEGNGDQGILTLNGNKEEAAPNRMGVYTGGNFTMNKGVTITGFNNSGSNGSGGVYVISGGITFTMYGGTITGNTASGMGGGGVWNNGTFTMSGGTITGNTASGNNGYGGGVYNSGNFTMSGGEISDNKVNYGGGGVNSSGTFTMSGNAKIINNTASGSNGYGGGVYVRGGTFTMSGGEISGNKAANSGGGVYVSSNGTTFIMNGNAKIINNTANSSGGGVHVIYGSFTMESGIISDNTASSGGGVCNSYAGDPTFTMSGGEISGNTANYGGGVYNYKTFTMSGGAIYGIDDPVKTNIVTGSGTRGVAFYNDNGTATYDGDYGNGKYTADDKILTGDNTIPPKSVPVTGVTLNKNTLTLTIEETGTLTATIAPANATNQTVTWVSGNTAVATVSNGTVTAVAVGGATITVTTADGNKTAICNVTVNKKTGAMVTQPTVNGSPTSDSITVNAVSLQTATGQSIEYAISTSTIETNLSAWQSGTTFTGLTAGTTYRVYARSKENATYSAGTENGSEGIATSSPSSGIIVSTLSTGGGSGGTTTLAIKPDGSLWGWGRNYNGQLGNGNTSSVMRPTQIGNESWAFVSSANGHNAAIKTDGSLWVCGSNTSGALGLGDTVNRNAFTRVGTDTNWVFVSAGYICTFAIKADGSLWAWGWNDSGRLGLGDTSDRNVPTRVGTDTDWAFVSAGYDHTAAIKADGSLWTWGKNNYGQLGDGNYYNTRNVPTQVGTDTDWALVSAGETFTVAVKTDGSLWTWGNNNYGQLGDGNYNNTRNVPTRVGTDNNWKLVSAGSKHTVAIKTDGSLWAWGYNSRGQIGNGSYGSGADRNVPTRAGTDTDWAFVAAGYDHNMAIKTDGSLWAWGYNSSDYCLGLGNYDDKDRYVPTRVPNW